MFLHFTFPIAYMDPCQNERVLRPPVKKQHFLVSLSPFQRYYIAGETYNVYVANMCRSRYEMWDLSHRKGTPLAKASGRNAAHIPLRILQI